MVTAIRKGFGRTLIEESLRFQLDAQNPA